MGIEKRRGAAPPHLPAKGREAFGNHDFRPHLYWGALSIFSVHLESALDRALQQ
jgi:hypothetical protein